jgi:uncharacterized protein YbjT (DUF2867 family)
MSSNDRLVLVTGATGSQGGAVARELLAKGWKVRAMTRKPEGEPANALAKLGAEVVRGDLDDPASVQGALKGAWGAWAVQNTWEAGVEKEERQGHAFAKAAREAGVQHLVYTSVGSAHRNTGIPHFENKWRVEKTVRSLGFPSFAVLRPVFFMENVTGGWFLQGDKLVSALQPDTKVQMVAVRDIGRYGAMLFERAEEMNGIALDLAGDELSMTQAASVLSKAMGKTITYQPIPMAAIRQNSEDFALMLEWFESTGYDANVRQLPKLFGVPTTSFEAWAASRG